MHTVLKAQSPSLTNPMELLESLLITGGDQTAFKGPSPALTIQ